MVGDMEESGRLPGSTRLATGLPSFSGAKLKSVSSLLRITPLATSWLPKKLSMVEVQLATSPFRSTATKWLVPTSGCGPAAVRGCAPGGVPGSEVRKDRSSRIIADRRLR